MRIKWTRSRFTGPAALKEKVNLPGVDRIFTVEEGKGVQPAHGMK